MIQQYIHPFIHPSIHHQEGGPQRWYELLSEWVSLDHISDRYSTQLLRSRYLVLSKLGVSKGYMVSEQVSSPPPHLIDRCPTS